jgi:hypothetical protein
MKSEPEARKAAIALLSHDFYIEEDVEGRHWHRGNKVVYDLVVRPKEHLLAKAFDPGAVIVECKHFRQDEGKAHDVKVRDLLWQCIAYSHSDITRSDSTSENPLFVLYWTSGCMDERGVKELNNLHHFVQRGGVGKLEAAKNGGWMMRFGGSYYYRSSIGKGPHNVGVKRMTGSSR